MIPLSAATSSRFQAWLRHRNANGWNVYVSVNAVLPGRSRTRRAIASIRHVFLEEDSNGLGLLATLTTRPDLPPPSYVLHSSPGRLHVFWRADGFECCDVETLQKTLARELQTDPAATSCAQTTRLPGFMNHKHERPWPVSIEYLRPHTVLAPDDFPVPTAPSWQRVGGGQRAVRAVTEPDDRPGARPSVPSVCRARGRGTAWRSAHVSNLLPGGAGIRTLRRRGVLSAQGVERAM